MKNINMSIVYYTPRTTKLLGGYIGFTPSVHPSVCASVRPSVRPSVSMSQLTSTVLPLVLGVVTRQKPQMNGSMVLGADESPWPCGTPSWYTPLSWMILSKQKNLGLFSSQYNCVFSCDQAALWMVFSVRLSVCPSVCPSVRLSVCLSVRLSVCPSVTPFWLCSHHRIIMKFSGVITLDQGKVHAKGQGQRSKVKVTEVTTQIFVSGL